MSEFMDNFVYLAQHLCDMTEQAYGLTLVGNPAGVHTAQQQRMQTWQVGDFVLIYHVLPSAPPLDRIGWLTEDSMWPYETDAEWAAMVAAGDVMTDTHRPERRVYIIRTLDGREVSWDNCGLLHIATEYTTP